MNSLNVPFYIIILVILMLSGGSSAYAAPGDGIRDRGSKNIRDAARPHREKLRAREDRPRHLPEKQRYASHYHHHRVGIHVDVLPPRHVSLHVSSQRYYYYAGVYYRPYGSTYVVVAAPVNARIAVLPFGFVSFVIGPSRYYYVNQTYYLYNPSHKQYVVVAAPQGGEQAAAKAQAETASNTLLVYPNNSQDQATQDQDRYECHVWAMQESGFDPTTMEPQADSERAQYRRAIAVCLEAREYTVG